MLSRILAATLLLLAVLPTAQAQERRVWIGVEGTGMYGLGAVDALVYQGGAECGTFTSGNVLGWSLGILFDHTTLFTSSLGLRARLQYGTATSTYDAAAVDPIVVRGENDSILRATHSYRLTAAVRSVRGELGLSLPIGDFLVTPGLTLDFPLGLETTQSDRLDPGGDVFFDSGRTEKPMETAEGYESSLRVGAVVGLSRYVALGSRVALVPTLSVAAIPGGPLAGHGGWQIEPRLSLALSIRLDSDPTGAADSLPPRRDTAIARIDTGSQTRPRVDSAGGARDRSLVVGIAMEGESGAEAVVLLNETIERTISRDGDTVESIERSVVPPRLSLQPAITAGAGVRRWTIDLLFEGKVVGRYADTGAVHDREVRWTITEEQAARPSSILTAKLTVVDSLGTIATAQSTLPIRFVRHGRIVLRDSSRRQLLATLFPPVDGTSSLSARDRAALAALVGTFPRGTQPEVIVPRGRASDVARARAVAEELRRLLDLRRLPAIHTAALDDRALAGPPPQGVTCSYEVAVRAALPLRGEVGGW